MPEELKNDFRDEIAAIGAVSLEVSDKELMLRDQTIMARAMESNHRLAEIKRQMLLDSLEECLDLCAFMQERPYSFGLSDLLEVVRVQVEGLKKAIGSPVVSRADAVQLAALQIAIRLAGRHDDPVIVQALTNAFAGKVTDVIAPIKDDGLPSGDDDDDNGPEEENEIVDPKAVSVKVE